MVWRKENCHFSQDVAWNPKSIARSAITIGHAEDGNSNYRDCISYGKYHLVSDNPDDFPTIISEDDAMETFFIWVSKLSTALAKVHLP